MTTEERRRLAARLIRHLERNSAMTPAAVRAHVRTVEQDVYQGAGGLRKAYVAAFIRKMQDKILSPQRTPLRGRVFLFNGSQSVVVSSPHFPPISRLYVKGPRKQAHSTNQTTHHPHQPPPKRRATRRATALLGRGCPPARGIR